MEKDYKITLLFFDEHGMYERSHNIMKSELYEIMFQYSKSKNKYTFSITDVHREIFLNEGCKDGQAKPCE